ncbi:MAG TPA: hypothetical protein VK968_13645 [Roseimicrobium sp.]|nr:hypothetical protein [Roseimicrobium sp.]
MNRTEGKSQYPGLLMLLLLAGILFSGCSTFHSRWRKEAAKPADASADITGRWEGTWLSSSNGHTGKLKCIVTQRSGDEYEFRYWATFWKLFSYSYAAEFKAPRVNGVYTIQGEKDLGWWAGGVYRHQGTASPTGMDSTYTSRYDSGHFQLKRPSTTAK